MGDTRARLAIKKFEIMKFVAERLGLGARNLSSGDLRRLEYTADQLLSASEEPDLENEPVELDGPFKKLDRELDEIQNRIKTAKK
jgi:hypothetical protein